MTTVTPGPMGAAAGLPSGIPPWTPFGEIESNLGTVKTGLPPVAPEEQCRQAKLHQQLQTAQSGVQEATEAIAKFQSGLDPKHRKSLQSVAVIQELLQLVSRNLNK